MITICFRFCILEKIDEVELNNLEDMYSRISSAESIEERSTCPNEEGPRYIYMVVAYNII
jgi:hypothetical protein